MGNKKKSANRKRYSIISLKKRQSLVTAVIDSGQSLSKVAKRLKIKLSTAKLILKKFKKTGVLFNKRLRNVKKIARNGVTRPLNQQPLIPVPLINKQQQQRQNQVQNIIVFPQVNFNQTERIQMLNSHFQAQWSWPWPGFYYIN